MWCSSCQQDVPGVTASRHAAVCCPRCHRALGGRVSEDAVGATGAARAESEQQALDGWDDWELRDELELAERLVRETGISPQPDRVRELPAGGSAPATTAPRSRKRASTRSSTTGARQLGMSVSWCLLSLGLVAFVFGAVLLGWSFWGERPQLWRLGLPFTLGGQAALVVALVMQLDCLWRSNVQAQHTLEEIDDQLHQLEHATSILSGTHCSPGQNFYVHLAQNASPHLLLADLKGQLDLLAQKLAD